MKNFIGALLLFTIMALASHAAAAEGDAGNWRAGITLASQHFIDPPPALGGFREDNLGFELEYQLTDTIYLGTGRYDNSIGARSNFFGIGKELAAGTLLGMPARGGLEGGIADGYEDFIGTDGRRWSKDGDFILMGGPYVRIGGQHALKLRYMFVLLATSYQYEF